MTVFDLAIARRFACALVVACLATAAVAPGPSRAAEDAPEPPPRYTPLYYPPRAACGNPSISADPSVTR